MWGVVACVEFGEIASIVEIPHRSRRTRSVLIGRLALAAALALAGAPAAAFDPFGWFGPKAPEPRRDALPYAVTIAGLDGASGLAAAAREASLLERLKDDAPQDGLSRVMERILWPGGPSPT